MAQSNSPKRSKNWIMFWIFLALLMVAELFVERHSHFGHHGVDASYGFFAIVGVVASVLCILLAVFLGMGLRAKETYYD